MPLRILLNIMHSHIRGVNGLKLIFQTLRLYIITCIFCIDLYKNWGCCLLDTGRSNKDSVRLMQVRPLDRLVQPILMVMRKYI